MELILIVDDDPGFRRLLQTILAAEGYELRLAGSVTEARQLGSRSNFHLVLSDLNLPDGNGIEVLDWFAERSPATPVVMITAYGTVESAVAAMKRGAVDYLGKPLSSPDELRLLVRRTLERNRMEQERNLLREEALERFSCASLIAEDPAMLKAVELSRKVAPTAATVLLTGESGTGKEVLARCIHANSPRSGAAFVAVNCAALSPTLIESELFGHEKGSFTGAAAQHLGRFERAHGGTLFLDEIGELDLALQAKLLRVLQERTFERVGGSRVITVDVRVIAATNRDLKTLTQQNKFREDLFYRLSTFPIPIPALRERPADIEPLATLFLARARPGLALSAEALRRLRRYNWPGNVRELENMMERAAIICDRVVTPADLPIPEGGQNDRAVTMAQIERQAIEAAMAANRGNRTRAAAQLGISLRTLQYRLKEYGLETP